jgi:hypothetical protein
MKMPVHPNLPDGFKEKHVEAPCKEAILKGEFNLLAYYCHHETCRGWIIGVPNIYKIDHRGNREFYCLRCGGSLGVVKL